MQARCIQCSSIMEAKQLAFHLRYVHGKNNDLGYGCIIPSCSRIFPTMKSLKNHQAKSHESQSRNSRHSFLETYESLDNIPSTSTVNNAVAHHSNHLSYCQEFDKSKNINHGHQMVLTRGTIVRPDLNLNPFCKRQSAIPVDRIITEENPSSIADELILEDENYEMSSDEDFIADYSDCALQNDCCGSEMALDIAIKFYSDLKLSRQHSQSIIHSIQNVINSPAINSLKSLVLESVNEQSSTEISEKFDDFQGQFNFVDTEYKFLKELTERNYYVPPTKLTINYVEEQGRDGTLENIKITLSFIPLKVVLKKFFELPAVYEDTCKYMTALSEEQIDGSIKNIVQTQLWKDKVKDMEGQVFPLFVDEDDCEFGNALGSHATIHKMTGLYVSILCLPPHLRAKLNTIFLCQIGHSIDIKLADKCRVYRQVIDDLNMLASDGVDLVLPTGNVKIYFKLVTIIGDNLGLNTILGFVQSFNANIYCRFCKITLEESRRSCVENPLLLRTIESYNSDLHLNDRKAPGIVSECAWTRVNGFHPTQNYCVDLVHDGLEGTFSYGLGNILYQYIFVQKLFSLSRLNFLIKYYDFSYESNRPPLISAQQLKLKKLKMSAGEMKSFVLNLGLIIGELIPKSNKFWKLYILMREILCVCLQISVTPKTVSRLEQLIKSHNQLYIKLFGPLKPKHHIFVHYPRIMSIMGPIYQLWTMRFEGKHRILTTGALVSCNHINVPYTATIKHQLHQGKIFSNREALTHPVHYQKSRTEMNNPTYPVPQYPTDFDEFEQIGNFSIHGNKYAGNTAVKCSKGTRPTFGIIDSIYKRKNGGVNLVNSDFAFIVRILETSDNDHLQSFQLRDTRTCQFIDFTSLAHIEPRKIHSLSETKLYVYYDRYLDA